MILACRNEEKARQARDKLESELDRSSLELLQVDLADLVSVRRAAETVLSEHARLDLLVNNAGVMGTPYRLTADGFELQMATNHFGHFALTGLLLDRIVTTERSRIVTVSSHLHRMGRLPADDIAGASIRNTWVSYGTSKLANLLVHAPSSAGGWTRPGLPTLGRGRPPRLDAQQPRRQRRRAREQPASPQGSAGRPGRRSASRRRRGPSRCCAPRPRGPSGRGSTSGRRTCSGSSGRPVWPGLAAPCTRRHSGRARCGGPRRSCTGVRYSVDAPV